MSRNLLRANPRTERRPLRRAEGFSLIELMVVILIIAVAATGTTMAIGALTRSRLRSACMKVASAARFAYGRSVTQGTTVRLHFDLDRGTMAIQESHGSIMLARNDDPIRMELDEGDEDSAAVDPWEAAKARLEDQLEPSFGRTPFGPIVDHRDRIIDRYTANHLSEGIAVVQLNTPHDPEPRTAGKGSIYFFPGGESEHAVVQLSNPRREVFSVEIAALTGRARVHGAAYEPDLLREEDELTDPG